MPCINHVKYYGGGQNAFLDILAQLNTNTDNDDWLSRPMVIDHFRTNPAPYIFLVDYLADIL